MIVFIINFNRVTLLKNMVNWCVSHDLVPIIVDNNSDYPPLLYYYENECPTTVLYQNENFGHTVVWKKGLSDIYCENRRYIVTDSDLDLSEVPSDFLQVLHNGLNKYTNYHKCGLSLEINDLPDTDDSKLIKNKFEASYWKKPLDTLYFNAPTDTTFALYRENVNFYTHSAIRTNRPYTAKHVPWYYGTDLSNLPEDEVNYIKTALAKFSTTKARLFV